jgi:hypothetical protein
MKPLVARAVVSALAVLGSLYASPLVAQRLFVTPERRLAVGDVSAFARSRLFQLDQIAAPVCPKTIWSYGVWPYIVQRAVPANDAERQWREIVMAEFHAAPGDAVFTFDPLATPFGQAGARRGDRIRDDIAALMPDAITQGAASAPDSTEPDGTARLPDVAHQQARFILQRDGGDKPISVDAASICAVGLFPFESSYSYVTTTKNNVFMTVPLLRSLNEDEVTMVLAHEVANVALDQVHLFNIGLLINDFSPIGTLIGIAKNRETNELPPSNKELVAADRLALWFLRPLRLGPSELLSFLERMDASSDVTMKASYTRTRPLTPIRRDALLASIKLYENGRKLYRPAGMSAEKMQEVVVAGDALRGSGSALAHTLPRPAPSGYANAAELDRVPVRPEGKDRFIHYLSLPSPKAFFVYASGGWRFWSGPDAMSKGFEFCRGERRPCWLYAVDDVVVWQADEVRRIGSEEALHTNSTKP